MFEVFGPVYVLAASDSIQHCDGDTVPHDIRGVLFRRVSVGDANGMLVFQDLEKAEVAIQAFGLADVTVCTFRFVENFDEFVKLWADYDSRNEYIVFDPDRLSGGKRYAIRDYLAGKKALGDSP